MKPGLFLVSFVLISGLLLWFGAHRNVGTSVGPNYDRANSEHADTDAQLAESKLKGVKSSATERAQIQGKPNQTTPTGTAWSATGSVLIQTILTNGEVAPPSPPDGHPRGNNPSGS